jgi:hypothetical protein
VGIFCTLAASRAGLNANKPVLSAVAPLASTIMPEQPRTEQPDFGLSLELGVLQTSKPQQMLETPQLRGSRTGMELDLNSVKGREYSTLAPYG